MAVRLDQTRSKDTAFFPSGIRRILESNFRIKDPSRVSFYRLVEAWKFTEKFGSFVCPANN